MPATRPRGESRVSRAGAAWLLVAALVAVAPTASAADVMCNGVPATIIGGPGDDELPGTDGPDVIAGLGGNDTIHALAEVRSAPPGSGGAEDPVRFGLPRVMSPLILSTVAIASGFGVLATSSIALVSGLGLAMCAAVVACLLADLSLLPSLLAADPQQRRN